MRAGLSRILCAILVGGLLSSAASAQSDIGIDKASSGRFTGLAVITDDLDWYDMFSRPETPSFSSKPHFAPGEWGALATIFSNAEAHDGKVEVRCDIDAFDPTGTRQVVRDAVCYEGPYRGDNILHPTLADLRFQIAPEDPPGEAGFLVTMRDAHSGHEVELRVSFEQGAQ
jgi:hypothetical protein